MENDLDTATKPTTSTANPVKTAKSSGGKGAKNRRRERRAAEHNPAKADAITNQAKSRLGLQSHADLLRLAPACAPRPTAVLVDLHASNIAIVAMLTRMRAIAQRPLALLLGDAGKVTNYRKVCSYLLFVRVCASQTNVSYAAGVPLDLVNAIDAERLRVIDARCGLIPNFFAWLLSQIGCFEYNSQKIVPTIPNPADEAVTIRDVLRGNFFSLCHYVHRHRSGQNGENIPAADEAFLPVVQAMYPVNIHNHRFTNATVATFDPVVTGIQWDDFAEINGALAEQKCCTRDFKLSEAIGTEVPRVRFMARAPNCDQIEFYSSAMLDDVTVRNALITRLGVDVDVPDNMTNSMFVMNRAQAQMTGSDVPAPYLQAQLQMLTKLEARQ